MLYVDIRKRLNHSDLQITLECGDGVLGVFGASGAGKSMTLKCIAGIEKPDSGVIVLNDRVLYDSKRRINLKPQERRVGYLFQDYALFPNMTVRGNILAGLHRLPRRERAAMAAVLEERFQIARLSRVRPGRLSGGERQRAALARLFASSPDLILLDEPFSSLDTVLKFRLIPMMKEAIASYGKGCLMVSHDVNELCAVCEQVTTIERGKNTDVIPADTFLQQICAQYQNLSLLTVNPPTPADDRLTEHD